MLTNTETTTKEDIQENQYAAAYHWSTTQRVEDRRYKNLTSVIATAISRHASSKEFLILDIGCGDGRSSYSVHKKLQSNGFTPTTVGCDVSERAITLANSEVARRNGCSGLSFFSKTVQELLKTEQVDFKGPVFVTMREVVEHLSDDLMNEILVVVYE